MSFDWRVSQVRMDEHVRAAYLHADRMLDLYGAAYVCQHPEILLGMIPAIDVRAGLAGDGQWQERYAWRGRAGEFPLQEDSPEDLYIRLTEAYRILDAMYGRK